MQHAGLPRSMPNADQFRSMPIKIKALIRNVSQCRFLPINSSQCRSMPDQGTSKTLVMPINAGSILLDPALIRIERNWSELIGIDRNWMTLVSMPEFWSTLIGIGHWSRESWTCNHKKYSSDCNYKEDEPIINFKMCTKI